ncbi:superoxide dismutase [Alkalihalobacillus pseudalcaliphilus]|uniref:superoxide dismutase n=1 Tax=Alkalihalobacillus pseudalcaliphilus TaxID=79884 RepID=UPI00064E12BD|nr:superoxide dismutase [Alkalihalobacillus pseudalcaliphilus]KMK76145.1 superoxide dismutase [Alkalihalobacillus pseudalcaliphilus]
MSIYISEVKRWYEDNKDFLYAELNHLSEQEKGELRQLLTQIEQVLSLEHRSHNQISDASLSHLLDSVYMLIEGNLSRGERAPVPIGGHTLPPLPYAYNALEPYISEDIMYLHHDKHHKSYVEGLNKAELEMQTARETGNYDLIKHWEREAAFNGAGHYLHSIFWEIMSPNGGGEPTGELLSEINRSFGSFDKMKEHFTHAADAVEGGGWAILVWSPRAKRLEILQAEKHQQLSQQDAIPLLVLDVWEHAYYLQYLNEKKDYVNEWWNIVNWPAVAMRYEKAKLVQWN